MAKYLLGIGVIAALGYFSQSQRIKYHLQEWMETKNNVSRITIFNGTDRFADLLTETDQVVLSRRVKSKNYKTQNWFDNLTLFERDGSLHWWLEKDKHTEILQQQTAAFDKLKMRFDGELFYYGISQDFVYSFIGIKSQKNTEKYWLVTNQDTEVVIELPYYPFVKTITSRYLAVGNTDNSHSFFTYNLENKTVRTLSLKSENIGYDFHKFNTITDNLILITFKDSDNLKFVAVDLKNEKIVWIIDKSITVRNSCLTKDSLVICKVDKETKFASLDFIDYKTGLIIKTVDLQSRGKIQNPNELSIASNSKL
jgi:hypothetical protein